MNVSRKLSTLAVLASIVWIGACAQIQALDLLNSVTPTNGYRLVAAVPYGPDTRQAFDLYHPATSNDGPLVVFIYGGAWRDGARQDYKFVGETLAKEGYTVVIPDYRLYPNVQYPGIIDDVSDAITELQQRADELEVSVDRIVLAGHSSGAHAAALLVSSNRYFKDQSFIAGLIGLSGPYDLPLDNPEVTAVFPDVDFPMHVKPPALVTSTHPPTLLLHGSDDERVLPMHTEKYTQRLLEEGVRVESRKLDGVGHAAIIAALSTRLKFLNDTREHVVGFLGTLE